LLWTADENLDALYAIGRGFSRHLGLIYFLETFHFGRQICLGEGTLSTVFA
jgi:hypothetical protein